MAYSRYSNLHKWLARVVNRKALVEIDALFPLMDASSAVFPTVRVSNDELVLAYHLADCEASAVVAFLGPAKWHYGAPNDEGLSRHPLWRRGLTFYNFHRTLAEPTRWIATFHDGTFEVAAKDVRVMSAEVEGDPSAALNRMLGPGKNIPLDSTANYSLKRTAATACGILTLLAAAAA